MVRRSSMVLPALNEVDDEPASEVLCVQFSRNSLGGTRDLPRRATGGMETAGVRAATRRLAERASERVGPKQRTWLDEFHRAGEWYSPWRSWPTR